MIGITKKRFNYFGLSLDYIKHFSYNTATGKLTNMNYVSNTNIMYQMDSLIYSAGITSSKKDVRNSDVNEYHEIHNVNLLGAILTLKYAYTLLKKGRGRVVVVSSLASRTYSQFSGFEYTVTKAALSGLVKQLAVEWANDGVLINTVFPSMVDTPLLRENVAPSILSFIPSNQ